MKKINLKKFEKLDKYQFKAVTSKRNVTLVLAGAGCGKTYTITSRVRYLIDYLKYMINIIYVQITIPILKTTPIYLKRIYNDKYN